MLRDASRTDDSVLAIITHPFKSTPQRAIICSGWHVHPRRWSSLNSPPRFWLICRAHSTKYYNTLIFAGFNTAAWRATLELSEHRKQLYSQNIVFKYRIDNIQNTTTVSDEEHLITQISPSTDILSLSFSWLTYAHYIFIS